MGLRRWIALSTVAVLALTVSSVASVASFAYRSPALHVAVETAAALISMLAALLVHGRFRHSLDRRDLLLTAALVMFAGANLVFSAVPAVSGLDRGAFGTWAPALSHAVATVLLVAAAFGASRVLHHPASAARRAVLLCGVCLLVIGVAIALADDVLPRAIDPGLVPDKGSRIAGAPSVVALQVVLTALFAAAALGFLRRAEHSNDPLIAWFAVGATFGAGARLNYALFPSLYSDYFYTGDVLRLAFFVALMLGGTQEIRAAQRRVERSAALDERRRLAREIHDGIAQDLAYIAQQAAELAQRPGAPEGLDDLGTAARGALDESRGIMATLLRPTDEPFGRALTRVATEAAGRWGAAVEADVADDVEVPRATREALLRIAGEAVTNAVRHGGARSVRVLLRADPALCLSIGDDGTGFDPDALDPGMGHHGIVGMRERAAELGGELRIGSRPGEGTQVVVVLP